MDYGKIVALDDQTLKILNEAQGDILYYNGTDWVRLAPGTDGYHLRTQGAAANPIWEAVDAIPTDLNLTSQSTGTICYYNGANWVVLAPSTAGNILQTNGAAAPTWVAPPSGGLDTNTLAVVKFASDQGWGVGNGSGDATYYNFNTEYLDIGSNYSGTTYTCPSAGYYLVATSYPFHQTSEYTTASVNGTINCVTVCNSPSLSRYTLQALAPSNGGKCNFGNGGATTVFNCNNGATIRSYFNVGSANSNGSFGGTMRGDATLTIIKIG